jgi:hypothetical protein
VAALFYSLAAFSTFGFDIETIVKVEKGDDESLD